jgi:Family of unknown function (DUF6152)
MEEVMSMNKLLVGLMTVAVLTFSLPLFAHHGRGDAYDTKNPLTLKATVTQVLYVNPHVQLYFDTKDAKGKVTHWNGEMTDIGQLVRAGWTKKRFTDALRAGTPVTVTIQKSKTPLPPGQGVAVVMKIQDEKGEVIGLVRRGAGGQE